MKVATNETMDYLGKKLLPKVYQFVVISLLQADKVFSPDLLKSIRSLYTKGEEIQKELLSGLTDKEKENSHIDCKKGCSFCCGLNVKVAVPELYIIFEHLLESRSNKDITRLIKDLKQFVQLKSNCTLRNERIMIKCTFLKDGSCSIYKVRPFACRAWNSTNVDICYDYLSNPDLDIPTSICYYAPYDTIRKAITKALFVVGLEDTTEELNAGVLRLLEGEFGK